MRTTVSPYQSDQTVLRDKVYRAMLPVVLQRLSKISDPAEGC